MILLIITILLINLCNSVSIFTYLMPVYNFTMHDTPIVWTNITDLEQERSYYSNMKQISFVHCMTSSVIAIVAITTTVPYTAPIPISWWIYHTYILEKSRHLSQKCDFLINGGNTIEGDRFKKLRRLSLISLLPDWIFEPSALVFHMWIFGFIYANILPSSKKGYKTFIILFLMVFYSYSFLHTLKTEIHRIDIKRDGALTKIMWDCQIGRMSFGQRVWKTWLTIWGVNTDEYGYLIDDTCRKLENELHAMDVSYPYILLKTITTPVHTLLIESLSSIKVIDKAYLIVIFVLLCILKHKFYVYIGKKNDNKNDLIKLE